MPLSFIKWPEKTKNGTASSGKLWLIEAIFCTPIDVGIVGSVTKNKKPEIPIAKATGAPTAIKTAKTRPRISISL